MPRRIALSLLFMAATARALSPEAEQRLRFEPCHLKGFSEQALCTTYEVFEDRAAQSGRKIPLHIAVVRALRRQAEPEPLFVLAGGPGQAASEYGPLIDLALREVRKTRDIVLVDQRGTGASNPLDCDIFGSEIFTSLPPGPELHRKLEACREKWPADVRFYTSVVGMEDLEEVRAVLGYERIHLLGGSYGTREALNYLRRHANHVGAVVLDGPAPFENKLPLYYARDGQRSMDRLFADCAADAACSAAFPQFRQEFAALLERLEREPLSLTLRHPRTGAPFSLRLPRQGFADSARNFLYATSHSALLPYLVHRLSLGEAEPFLALVPEVWGWSLDTMSLGKTISVLCSEDLPRATEQEAQQLAEGSFLGTGPADQWRMSCEGWPRGELPQDYDRPVRFEVPALILTGALDPVTAPPWGEVTAAYFTRPLHVTVDGASHGTMHLGCVPKLIARFLDQGGGEGLDTSCVQSIRRPPFVIDFAGPMP